MTWCDYIQEDVMGISECNVDKCPECALRKDVEWDKALTAHINLSIDGTVSGHVEDAIPKCVPGK